MDQATDRQPLPYMLCAAVSVTTCDMPMSLQETAFSGDPGLYNCHLLRQDWHSHHKSDVVCEADWHRYGPQPLIYQAADLHVSVYACCAMHMLQSVIICSKPLICSLNLCK